MWRQVFYGFLVLTRWSSTLYGAVEAFLKVRILTKDDLLAGLVGLVVLVMGVAVSELQQDGAVWANPMHRKVASGLHMTLIAGVHMVVALCLYSQVKSVLNDLLDGYQVNGVQAYGATLLVLLVIEAAIRTLPRQPRTRERVLKMGGPKGPLKREGKSGRRKPPSRPAGPKAACPL